MRFYSGIIFLIAINVYGQEIPLVNSGEVLQQAKVLLDSGKRDAAIQLYLSVPQQDTNHLVILKELAFAYLNNDQYDKSLAVASEGLAAPSRYHAEFLRAQAAAMGWKGDWDASMKLFEEALKQYPTDLDLRYSRAILYFNRKDYAKATREFFSIIAINPYYRGCHLHLGLIAIREGRKVHGLFAMGIYLSLAPDDNPRLQLVNNFADNAVTDEGVEAPIGPNASDKLDQIIRARIAMEEGFQSAIPAKAPVIRQYELLFSQLATLQASPDNPWTSYYLPIYKSFYDKQLHEAFIYHILTSSPIEVAAKWRTKNKDKLGAFYDLANLELKRKRERISHPEFPAGVHAWYYTNNLVEALGEKVTENQRTGKWIIYHENGTVEAIGEYDGAGIKKGTWKFFRDNGTIKSIENYDTGEVTVYHEDGSKAEHFFLKDDVIHGYVETFYPGGIAQEKMNYTKGKRDGKYEIFFPDGILWRTFTYVNGEVEGEFRRYYANGRLASREFYKAGLSEGPVVSYHPNGRKESEGEYRGDKIFGPWKYYDANGRLTHAGKFSDKGWGIGEWVYYDPDGAVNERRRFDDDGNWHGEDEFFHGGKPYCTVTYKKGMRIKVVNFRDDGTVLSTYGSNDGNFSCTFHYPGGERKQEGKFVKGEREGTWKYYSRFGKLTRETDWSKDSEHGKSRGYHPSGVIREEANYVEGELDGYYVSYDRNGKIEQQGWMQNGQRQQRWVTYTLEGTIQNDHYYLNGKLKGLALDYAFDGKMAYSATYDGEEGASNVQVFDSQGLVSFQSKHEGWKTVYESVFGPDRVRERYSMACGKYYGEQFRGYPDGNPHMIRQYLNGSAEASFRNYYANGQLFQDGNYLNGTLSGIWKTYFETGKLYSAGKFLQGNQDSLWVYNYSNGNRSMEAQFVNDERHGISRYFSPTGVPLLEKLFDEGDITHYRPVKPDGTVGDWIRFDGNATILLNYPDGSPAWKETFKDGYRHGHHLIYYPGGQVYLDLNFELGDYQGPFTYYHPDGKILEKGVYRDDEREGLNEVFRENGTPLVRENFRMGLRYGHSTYYDEQGKILKDYVFWNNIPQK